jgi:hypothetical protein
MAAIFFRHNDTPALYIHDGAIQIEEAIKFSWRETRTSRIIFQHLWHNGPITIQKHMETQHSIIYIPSWDDFDLNAFLSVVKRDPRMVRSALCLPSALIGLLPLLLLATRSTSERLCVFMTVGLNPLLAPFFIEGRNDMFVLFWLAGDRLSAKAAVDVVRSILRGGGSY